MGVFTGGGGGHKRARHGRCAKAKGRRTKGKQKPRPAAATPPTQEELAAKVAYYCRTLQNVNPFVSRRNYVQKVYHPPPKKLFMAAVKTDPHEIRFLYPYRSDQITHEWIAHMHIRYHSGRLPDWHMKFADMMGVKRNPFPPSTIKWTPKGPHPFMMSPDTVKAAQHLFEMSQRLRWAMKNLWRIWILRKSLKRTIGEDSDMITMETIPLEEQCRVVCMATRCVYVFSGNTLMKSMKSNIECQVAAIPDVKSPKNPFTNLKFTYGQMLELYHQLMVWCAKKRKAFPTSLSLYRETGFRPHIMVKLHHNYLQYKASIVSFIDDDPRGELFLEILETILETYSHAMPNYNDTMTMRRFGVWFVKEPNSYLMRLWRLIVADYWYYEQTGHLAREHWRSDNCIINDINILLRASDLTLRTILRP